MECVHPQIEQLALPEVGDQQKTPSDINEVEFPWQGNHTYTKSYIRFLEVTCISQYLFFCHLQLAGVLFHVFFLLACSFATTSHLRYASRNLRTVNIPTSRACGKLPNHHYNANWPRSKIRYGWFDERPRYERCLCLKKLDVTGRNTSVFCFSRRVNTKSLKIVQHGQVAYLFACRAVLSTFRVNLLYSSWGTAEH